MGIKNLKALIEKCKNSLYEVPLSNFRGKRIAIDANNIAIIALTPAWRQIVMKTKYPSESPDMELFNKMWISTIKRQIERFLIAGITPVYVFDGTSPPEKEDCRKDRRAKRNETETKFKALMENMSNFNANQVPEVFLNDARKQASKMWPYTIEILKSILLSIGLPVIQGGNDGTVGCEAERICANLCLDGYCSATLSTDGDTLVHGCPILIKKFLGSKIPDNSPGQPKRQEMVQIIDLRQLLLGLKLSFKEFIEVCIMSGCDYNNQKNIRGIGSVKSWKLIQQHKSIDNLPPKYDVTTLKHLQCRRLFSKVDINKMIVNIDGMVPDLAINVSALSETAIDVLSQYQMQGWIGTLMTLYSLVPKLERLDARPTSPPNIIIVTGKTIITLIVN